MGLLDTFRNTVMTPVKATKTFVKNPSFENLGGAMMTGGLKESSDLAVKSSAETPWKFDDKLSGAVSKNFVDNKDAKQATGAIGALIAAIYGGAALGGGAAAGGAAGAGTAGAGTAGAGATGAGATGAAGAGAGSYGAGAYGTAAGYGGATAPAATGSIGAGGGATAGGGLLGTAGGYAKTGLQAMQAAQLAQNLFGPQQKQIPQISQPSGAGAQELAALNQSRMQSAQNTAASAGDRQRRNQEIIQQMMMGRNYG